jgi:aspartate/methionine/tyrosine aminotransferase
MEFGTELNKRTISVYGFSKSFSIAGLRAGLLYCSNQDVFDKLVEFSQVDSTIGGISSISQIAAIACLDKAYYRVDEFITVLTQNRDYALKRLESMPGIKCHKPTATFVLFPDITETGMKATELVEYLHNEFKIALVPGGERFFGPGSEGHIRICLATSPEILTEGLDRLERGLNSLMK